MNAQWTRRLRQISQAVSFGLFMFLFVQAVYLGRSPLPSDLFYRLDPLIAATAMLAGRAIKAGLLYSLISLAATLVFGRVWCGWLCPFGTFLEWVSARKPAKRVAVPESLRGTKYILLAGLLTAAALGNQTLVFLDPVSIMTRSMTTVLWPGLRFWFSDWKVSCILWNPCGRSWTGSIARSCCLSSRALNRFSLLHCRQRSCWWQ